MTVSDRLLRNVFRILPTALLLLDGLAFSGCAPLPPEAPAAALIDARPDHGRVARAKDAFTAGAWPREAWWRAFGDRDLNRLAARALVANPDVAAARDRLAAARAAVQDARARQLPSVALGAGLEGEYFSATGEHSLLNGRSVLFGRLEPLRAVYDPDISGRNAHRLAAAVGAQRMHGAQRAAVRLDITTALARTWFTVAELDGALAAQRRQRALTERLYTVQKARLAAGVTDAEGAFAARQALARLSRTIGLEEGRRAALLAAAAVLAGESPVKTAELRPRPPALERFPVPADLPVALLRHRPDVVAALWGVEAAREQVEAAHAAFYPRLNLALFAGWNSIHLADLLNPANFARGAGLAVSLPIFEGGALRAHLQGARARYDLAVDRYNARILAAVKEVAAGLASWKANREALEQSRTGVAAAKARVRVRAAAFHAGLTNALPEVQADISAAVQAEQEAHQRGEAARSWVDLVGALGGGYRAPDGKDVTPAATGRPPASGRPAAGDRTRRFGTGRRGTEQ